MQDVNILKATLLEPYNQIQISLGGNYIISPDVIDPTDAIFYAVENACSVVAQLATIDSITVEKDDPLYGEGEFEIARMLKEYVISQKIQAGQLKENEAMAYRDFLGGKTEDEIMYFYDKE